jgi:hypothetical protein
MDDTYTQNFKTTYIVIPVFIDNLQKIVKELKTAYGPDLLTAQVPAALLISDILDAAEATDRERELVLGKALAKRVAKNNDETAQLAFPLQEMVNHAPTLAAQL